MPLGVCCFGAEFCPKDTIVLQVPLHMLPLNGRKSNCISGTCVTTASLVLSLQGAKTSSVHML